MSRPSLQQAIQLYEVRAVIEGLIARGHGPGGLTDDHLARLAEFTDDMVRFADKGDAEATVKAGERIHDFLRGLSRNKVATDILEQLHGRIEHYRNLTVRAAGHIGDAAKGHRALLEVLQTRDAERAKAEIRQHILRASDFLVEYSTGEAATE